MNYDYLKASDGSGDPVIMHITADRSVGSLTIEVDFVTGVPEKFIGTYGTLLSSGFIDPATKRDFLGHLAGGNVQIDDFEPGAVDAGNVEGQVVVIRPSTPWANRVAAFIEDMSSKGDIAPAGAVMDFAGSTTPDGWLLCYGQAISRLTYADLFTAIGTTYGAGNGTTTFNVPDARGRVTAGKDNMGGSPAGRLTGEAGGVLGTGLGNTGGEETHILTTPEMPAHDHATAWPVGFPNGTSSLTVNDQLGDRILVSDNFSGVNGVLFGDARTLIAVEGDGDAHNNVQPTLILNKIIKT